MKVIVNQYEIKQAIQYYLEYVKKLNTKSFPQLEIKDGKVTAEVELAEESSK